MLPRLHAEEHLKNSCSGGGSVQCDQIVKLFFNIWPCTTKKICPIVSQQFAKLVLKFRQVHYKPSHNCHGFDFFPKVAKIRQICSHWISGTSIASCCKRSEVNDIFVSGDVFIVLMEENPAVTNRRSK